ncbi:MAG TPA: hypothetical protein VHK27_15510 [Gammaproteobacteria bacterium]|nr:hypothetical protein [Gammaproteobacteria bacterium]
MRLVTYDYNQKHQLAVVQDNWVIIPSLVGGRPLEVDSGLALIHTERTRLAGTLAVIGL